MAIFLKRSREGHYCIWKLRSRWLWFGWGTLTIGVILFSLFSPHRLVVFTFLLLLFPLLIDFLPVFITSIVSGLRGRSTIMRGSWLRGDSEIKIEL